MTLWQLVNAYRTLANGGRYSPLTLILKDVEQKADTFRPAEPGQGQLFTPSPTLRHRGGGERIIGDAPQALLGDGLIGRELR